MLNGELPAKFGTIDPIDIVFLVSQAGCNRFHIDRC